MFAVLLISALFASSFGQDWDYHGETGPSEWPRLYPEFCSYNSQSPINISDPDTNYDLKLVGLSFGGYSQTLKNSRIRNSGRTVYIIPNAEETYTVQGGGLPNKFFLEEIHFHWGKNNTLGSEHAIDGSKFPLEAHFVHRNEKYSTVNEAVSNPDGLAVLGVFYKISTSPPLSAMAAITEALKDIQPAGSEKSFNLGFASVDSLLPPPTMRHFYRCNGSLTTPNCNEAVIWTVFRVPQVITDWQIGEFRKLLASSEGDDPVPLVDNFRPIQPLNNRVVLRSFPSI